MFTPTPRFTLALSNFAEAHSTDPENESSTYHRTLASYATKLSNQSPSEALLLAANSQHIRRWEKPRDEYAMGLGPYKAWRMNLNKFHAEVCREIMISSGYTVEEDSVLLGRVGDLLLKKTLQRPPLSTPLKDREMHILEDAICLTFLSLQFAQFTQAISDEDKMVVIVRKTWAKMTDAGHAMVVSELLEGMPEELKLIVGKALA